jgi:hypothetical protein
MSKVSHTSGRTAAVSLVFRSAWSHRHEEDGRSFGLAESNREFGKVPRLQLAELRLRHL